MRTTLVIDDAVFRRAKEQAARAGLTLSQLVEQALRDRLARRRTEPLAPYRMLTYGPRRKKVQHEPADFARELEREDTEALRAD